MNKPFMKTFLVSLTFRFFGYAAVAQDDLLSLVDDDSKEKNNLLQTPSSRRES
jgi:hypothetical protein